jgi:NAD-dependent SIR2 family protein deacetylase
MTSTPTYSEKVERAVGLLSEADYILIGAGAGLSAAAGLNYQDPVLFQTWYPQFARLGMHTIWEGVTAHWSPDDRNRRRFWAFWAYHIQKIRYEAPPGQVYLDLLRLVAQKKHFVITTNVDGQFIKAGFDAEYLYTPQGDYGKFQCAGPCSQILYDNHAWVQQMLSFVDPRQQLVREEDIPRCPRCGDYLERNLRIDDRFVEEPYLAKQPDFTGFVSQSTDGKLVLLELGVGFNTPVIIRYPFEWITARHPYATLIRINLADAQVPPEIEAKALCFPDHVAQVLKDLLPG